MRRSFGAPALLAFFSLQGCFGGCDDPPAPAKKALDPCGDHDPAPWPWRPAAQGMWGEDPKVAPDFCYPQERRAPKMPDAGDHLHRLEARSGATLADATLICEIEIYSRHGAAPSFYRYKLGAPPETRPTCSEDWDTFNAPDALVRLRLRDEYPISLFGPEDHWGFFVSVPRISLAPGDKIALKLWDRDSNDVYSAVEDAYDAEFMGAAELTWDGKLPIWLRAPFFTATCNAMTSEQALAAARPKLDGLETEIRKAEGWRPDPNVWGFGANPFVSAAEENFEILIDGNFRYPAGFVGWDHPEIQRRLVRRKDVLAKEPLLRRELVASLRDKAAGVSRDKPFNTPGGKLRIGEIACAEGDCTVAMVAEPSMERELCRPDPQQPRMALAAVDPDGKFNPVRIERQVAPGTYVACASAAPSEDQEIPLRATLSAKASLLWLGGAGEANVVALPAKAGEGR
jgi:hypothetical protein